MLCLSALTPKFREEGRTFDSATSRPHAYCVFVPTPNSDHPIYHSTVTYRQHTHEQVGVQCYIPVVKFNVLSINRWLQGGLGKLPSTLHTTPRLRAAAAVNSAGGACAGGAVDAVGTLSFCRIGGARGLRQHLEHGHRSIRQAVLHLSHHRTAVPSLRRTNYMSNLPILRDLSGVQLLLCVLRFGVGRNGRPRNPDRTAPTSSIWANLWWVVVLALATLPALGRRRSDLLGQPRR